MGNLLDLEDTVLNDGLDQEGAVAGLLDGDVNAGGEAGLGLLELLSTLVLVLEVQLIAEGGIVEFVLLADVLDVGDGEADADAKRSFVSALLSASRRRNVNESGVEEIVLLVAELLGQDNLLLTLNILNGPLAILDNSVDVLLLLLELGDVRRLLVLQLILKLGEKVDIA